MRLVSPGEHRLVSGPEPARLNDLPSIPGRPELLPRFVSRRRLGPIRRGRRSCARSHWGAAAGSDGDARRAGTARSAVTTEHGEFWVKALPPGRYVVTFALPGFAPHTRPGVDVASGGVVRIDIVLQVALHAEVTVTGRYTFRNLAELDPLESGRIGLAPSASVGVVTARQMGQRPIQRPAEVLETVPGLSVTQHSGEGKANAVLPARVQPRSRHRLRHRGRGRPGEHADACPWPRVHGRELSSFRSSSAACSSSRDHTPPTVAISRRPAACNINYANRLEGPMLRVSFGGQGWSRVLAAASPRVGGGQLLAAAETARFDGPWEQPDAYRRYNGVLRYSRGDHVNNLALTALAYRGRWHATDQAPRRAIDSGALPRFGGVDSTTGGETGRYPPWRNGSAGRPPPGLASPATPSRTISTCFRISPISWTTRSTATSSIKPIAGWCRVCAFPASASSSWAVGSWTTALDCRCAATTSGASVSFARGGASGCRRFAKTRWIRASAGVWVDADVRWTPWLRSIAGVRADGYRFQVSADRSENSGTATAGLVSPRGSIVFGPWRRTELYVNAGSGFHSNDARGATMRVDPGTGLPVDRVTPLARTRGAEVGVRVVAFRGVQSTIALWRLALDSELVFVGDAGVTAPSRPSERHGLEWSNFVRVRQWMTLDGDVAWSARALHRRPYRGQPRAGVGRTRRVRGAHRRRRAPSFRQPEVAVLRPAGAHRGWDHPIASHEPGQPPGRLQTVAPVVHRRRHVQRLRRPRERRRLLLHVPTARRATWRDERHPHASGPAAHGPRHARNRFLRLPSRSAAIALRDLSARSGAI